MCFLQRSKVVKRFGLGEWNLQGSKDPREIVVALFDLLPWYGITGQHTKVGGRNLDAIGNYLPSKLR